MGGKTASPLRAGLPPFCPIGLGVICCPVAAEFLPGLRPLVTGAVGIRLRLTALGLKDFVVLLSETRGLSREAGSREQKNQLRLPLQKAVRRSPTRSPPQIGCPKESGRFCGCAASSPEASDWENRGPGCPRRRFGYFAAEGKVTRVRAGEAREPSPEAAGFGRNAPPVPPAKNKTRLCLTKRQRRERPLRYHSSCPGDRGHSSL